MPFGGAGINRSPRDGDEIHFSFPFPLQPDLAVIATCLDYRFCMTITATCHHAAHAPLSMRIPKRPALTADVFYIESGVKKSMIAALTWLQAEQLGGRHEVGGCRITIWRWTSKLRGRGRESKCESSAKTIASRPRRWAPSGPHEAMGSQLKLPEQWAWFESRREPTERLNALHRDVREAKARIREVLDELADRHAIPRARCRG
jgi:hypothetical protein